jgi:hypothetical protein
VTALILVFCALGFVAAVVPAVDAFLSTVFVWVFAVVGGVAFVGWLVVELRDWLRWMELTNPPPRAVRVKRAPTREGAGR